jgi:hypothetical protein
VERRLASVLGFEFLEYAKRLMLFSYLVDVVPRSSRLSAGANEKFVMCAPAIHEYVQSAHCHPPYSALTTTRVESKKESPESMFQTIAQINLTQNFILTNHSRNVPAPEIKCAD